MKKKYRKPTVETVRIDAPNVLFSGSPDDDDGLFSRGGNGPGSHGKACEHGSATNRPKTLALLLVFHFVEGQLIQS